MQQTSLQAYDQILVNLGERQTKVLKAFEHFGWHTNLELTRLLRLPVNQLTPRTNELVKLGLLEEKNRRACQVSGRRAIVWGVS